MLWQSLHYMHALQCAVFICILEVGIQYALLAYQLSTIKYMKKTWVICLFCVQTTEHIYFCETATLILKHCKCGGFFLNCQHPRIPFHSSVVYGCREANLPASIIFVVTQKKHFLELCFFVSLETCVITNKHRFSE